MEGKGGRETMGGDQREPVRSEGERAQLRGPVRGPQGGRPQGPGGCAEEPPR